MKRGTYGLANVFIRGSTVARTFVSPWDLRYIDVLLYKVRKKTRHLAILLLGVKGTLHRGKGVTLSLMANDKTS